MRIFLDLYTIVSLYFLPPEFEQNRDIPMKYGKSVSKKNNMNMSEGGGSAKR